MKKNISMIDACKVADVSAICDCAEKNDIVKRIIVFGSTAQKQCTDSSDLDICIDVVGETRDMRLHEFRVQVNKICDYNCDIVIYSQIGSNLRNEINTKGVVVYEA